MYKDIARRLLELHRNFHSMDFAKIKKCVNQSEYYTLIRIKRLSVDDENENPVGKGVSMTALAKELRVTPPMVTKTVTALEKKGYVKRISKDGDRRGVNVCLTETGYDNYKAAYDKMHEYIERVFDRFGEEKTLQLLEMTEEIIAIASQELDAQLKKEER